METGNLSLADIAAVTGKETGMFGGDGGMWIFALLILVLLGGGNGIFGGNRVGEAYATQGDVQRAVNMSALSTGQANIAADIQRAIYEVNGTTKDSAYNNLSEIRDVQAAIGTGFANMQSCCCETNRNIDSVRFDIANYASAIQANSTANAQKVLDAISANKIAELTNQVNELKTQNMFCGVPRINPYVYGIVPQYGCNA